MAELSEMHTSPHCGKNPALPAEAFSMYFSSASKPATSGNFSLTVFTMKCNKVLFLSLAFVADSYKQ